MKNLLFFIILAVSTIGVAQARPVTEKYCIAHERSFNREIDYKVSKGTLSNSRGNIIKLTAHNRCTNAAKAGESVSDFKLIFKRVKEELCESTLISLNSVLKLKTFV